MRSDAPARIYTDANRKYRLPVRLETTNSFRRTVSQKTARSLVSAPLFL